MQAENGGGTIQTSLYDILILLFQIKPLKYEFLLILKINDVISSMVIFLSAASHATLFSTAEPSQNSQIWKHEVKNMPRASFSPAVAAH